MAGRSTTILSFVLISLTLFSAPVTSAPHLSKRATASLKCWGCTPEQLAALKIAQAQAVEALSGLEKVLGYANVEKSLGFDLAFPANVLLEMPVISKSMHKRVSETPKPNPDKILEKHILPTLGALQTEITLVSRKYNAKANDILFSFPEKESTAPGLPPCRTTNSLSPDEPSTHIAFLPVDLKDTNQDSLKIAKSGLEVKERPGTNILTRYHIKPPMSNSLFLILINELQRACPLLGADVCIPQPDPLTLFAKDLVDRIEYDSTRQVERYGHAALASITRHEDFLKPRPPRLPRIDRTAQKATTQS